MAYLRSKADLKFKKIFHFVFHPMHYSIRNIKACYLICKLKYVLAYTHTARELCFCFIFVFGSKTIFKFLFICLSIENSKKTNSIQSSVKCPKILRLSLTVKWTAMIASATRMLFKKKPWKRFWLVLNFSAFDPY